MDAVKTTAYVDVCGRRWMPQKLDDLLAIADVKHTVLSTISRGIQPSGLISWDAIEDFAFTVRYRRKEAGALLLLLVRRHFETAGRHYRNLREGTR